MKCNVCNKNDALYITPNRKGLCRSCYEKQYKNIKEDKTSVQKLKEIKEKKGKK